VSGQNPAISDAALLERLLAGDEEAFTQLVAGYHQTLKRLALLFVADPSTADEVVQDTWLGVIKGLPAFERRASLRTWIFRILVNRARTRGEREGRIVAFSARAASNDDALVDRFTAEGRWIQPPSPWHQQNPEQLLMNREAVQCLHHAIEALPPNQRAVVTLRDIEGLGPSEVCNVLEISETNQRVLLHRARTKLRAALEHHLKGR
jgi:RNA polymerase sigma-70 factor (ECF subfamily)